MDNHLLEFLLQEISSLPSWWIGQQMSTAWHWDCEMAQHCSINNSVWHLKPCLQSESNDLLCLTHILSLWKYCKKNQLRNLKCLKTQTALMHGLKCCRKRLLFWDRKKYQMKISILTERCYFFKNPILLNLKHVFPHIVRFNTVMF